MLHFTIDPFFILYGFVRPDVCGIWTQKTGITDPYAILFLLHGQEITKNTVVAPVSPLEGIQKQCKQKPTGFTPPFSKKEEENVLPLPSTQPHTLGNPHTEGSCCSSRRQHWVGEMGRGNSRRQQMRSRFQLTEGDCIAVVTPPLFQKSTKKRSRLEVDVHIDYLSNHSQQQLD